MCITVATQPSSYCCDVVERHGRCINEFPVNENSFFNCMADQLSSHLVMLEDGTKVPPYVVRKDTCNYIKDHAEELQVNTIVVRKINMSLLYVFSTRKNKFKNYFFFAGNILCLTQ